MNCISEIYHSFYYKDGQQYCSKTINIKKMNEQLIRKRLNQILRNQDCSCQFCNPDTSNHYMVYYTHN